MSLMTHPLRLVGITGPDYTKPYATNEHPLIFVILLKSGFYLNSCLICVVYMRNLILALFCYNVVKNVAKAIYNYLSSFFYPPYKRKKIKKDFLGLKKSCIVAIKLKIINDYEDKQLHSA